jgi:hypothetical protein
LGIEGEFVSSLGTSFVDDCECKPVTLAQAYDVVEKWVSLEGSLLTTSFLITAIALILTALVVGGLLLLEEPRAKNTWVEVG